MSNPLQRIEMELMAALEAEEFEVVDAQFGTGKFLKLIVDRDGGITLEECVRAHKLVRNVAFDMGYDPGDFRIEVESPGADRTLTRPKDFERFRGSRVRVQLKEKRAEDGRRSFVGILDEADEEMVRVVVDDIGTTDFEREQIERVKLEV